MSKSPNTRGNQRRMHSCIPMIRLIAENAGWVEILCEWDLNEMRAGGRSCSKPGNETLDKLFNCEDENTTLKICQNISACLCIAEYEGLE